MWNIAHKQRSISGSFRSATLALGFVGVLIAGVVTYTDIIDGTDNRTTDVNARQQMSVVGGSDAPGVVLPDPVHPTLSVTTNRTDEEWFFREQNWNLESPPPGRIDTVRGGQDQQPSREDTFYLEQNTLFLPGDSGNMLPYADHPTESY